MICVELFYSEQLGSARWQLALSEAPPPTPSSWVRAAGTKGPRWPRSEHDLMGLPGFVFFLLELLLMQSWISVQLVDMAGWRSIDWRGLHYRSSCSVSSFHTPSSWGRARCRLHSCWSSQPVNISCSKFIRPSFLSPLLLPTPHIVSAWYRSAGHS